MDTPTTWSSLYAKRAYDDTAAVIGEGFRWSSRELTERGAGAADWLDEIGAPTGQPFAAVVSATSDAYALAIGAVGSHRPIAPLGARLTSAELAASLGPLNPSVVITERFAEAVTRRACEALSLRVEVHPTFERSSRPLEFVANPKEYAAILHTSGTSGRPKPVPYPQGRLAHRTRVNGSLLRLKEGCLYASASPFHHIAGLGAMFVTLGAGAALCPLARFTVDSWADVVELGITHAQLVPSMVEDLLDRGMLVPGKLHLLQYGASRIHPDTLRRILAALPDVALLQMYGQTEGSPLTVLSPEDHHRAATGAPELLTSAGCAVEGVELVVHEPGLDGIGEVWARADHFMKPDADGWLRTGDLGRLDSNGYLSVIGRKGDMIIRGGENVYPDEVEEVLRGHPAIADVAVVGDSDRRLGQRITAHIVVRDIANPPTVGELRAFSRSVLAGFKVPEQWHFHEVLPRNAAGKILRRSLVDLGDAPQGDHQ